MIDGGHEGRPHVFAVYTGAGSDLPPGLIGCGVCGFHKSHREIRAFDADLGSYLCKHCFFPMEQAEYWLRVTPGVRPPTAMEAVTLESIEERRVA